MATSGRGRRVQNGDGDREGGGKNVLNTESHMQRHLGQEHSGAGGGASQGKK